MWSPQLYKEKGLDLGLSENLLDASIAYSEEVINSQHNLPSILSLKHLSERTGVSYRKLRKYVTRGDYDAYKKFSIRKQSGGRRFIRVPAPSLMATQKWINEFILKEMPVHPASHAFKIGSSIQKCATKHCGAQWLIKVDVMDFFESVSEIQIFRTFKELGYQPLVAFELGRLCTIATPWESPRRFYENWRVRKYNESIPEYNQGLLGYLPQGAPTSPLLSNLIMRNHDAELSEIAKNYGLTYTRYSDDLSFSTRSKTFNRVTAKEVIKKVYDILSRAGFRPQYRKTKIIPPGSKKIILGLNVDGAVPRLQKEFKDRLRQHLYYLEKLGPIEHASRRKFDSVWGMKCHIKGLIDYANMIEPEYSVLYLEKFEKLDWPV